MISANGFSLWDLFLSMLWFFLFFIWLMLLFRIFADIFRSDDMGGFAKALWVIFVIVLPFLGVLIYLIVRGHKMNEHAVQDMQAQEQAMRSYVQNVAGSGGSPSEEIARLAELHKAGTISDAEFQQAKAKLLA